MSDEFAGGAPAPAEVTATPEIASNTPEPITETTPRGAIDRAFAAVDAGATQVEAKPKPEQSEAVAETGDRERNPDGTFKAKEAAADGAEQVKAKVVADDAIKAEPAPGDAPARFSPDAKAVWATAPEALRAETLRMERELTAGVEKYREDATAFDSVREYAAMAQEYGTDLRSALDRYVAMDKALNDNPLQGLMLICQDKGLDPRQIAAAILGEQLPPEELAASQAAQTIQSLQNEIAQLKQGVQGIQMGTYTQQVDAFLNGLDANDQAIFHEFSGSIADLIKKGSSLQDAFAQAKEAEKTRVQRLAAHFGLNAQPPALPAPTPDLTAQTQKGQLSVSGAPSSGSNPSNRKPPSSPREALNRAFDVAGL